MDCSEITQIIEKYQRVNASLLEIVSNPTAENIARYNPEQIEEYDQELERYALYRWVISKDIVKTHHFKFDFKTGLSSLPPVDLDLTAIRLSPDGKKMAVVTGVNEISILDPVTGGKINVIEMRQLGQTKTTYKMDDIEFSPSGKYLFARFDFVDIDDRSHHALLCYDTETGEEVPGRVIGEKVVFVGDDWMLAGSFGSDLELESITGERHPLWGFLQENCADILRGGSIKNIAANTDGAVALKTASHFVVFNAFTEEMIYSQAVMSPFTEIVAVPNSTKFLINIDTVNGIDTYWFDYAGKRDFELFFGNRLLTDVCVDIVGKVVAAIEFQNELTIRSIENGEIFSNIELPKNMGEIDRLQLMDGHKIGVVYKSGRVLIYGKKPKEKPKPVSKRWLPRFGQGKD